MDKNVYKIRVKGHLDGRWFRQFEGLTITLTPNGETVLAGPIVDQAALHGLLNRIRDLGLELIAVQRQPIEDEKKRMIMMTNRQKNNDES